MTSLVRSGVTTRLRVRGGHVGILWWRVDIELGPQVRRQDLSTRGSFRPITFLDKLGKCSARAIQLGRVDRDP